MRQSTIQQIDRETERAIKKHGRDSIRTRSLERAGLILGEEAGEVQQAILDHTAEFLASKNRAQLIDELHKILEESIHTASVATRIIERLMDELYLLENEIVR